MVCAKGGVYFMANIWAECAYIVRYVEFTNRPRRPPWSLRQFAVYHKYMPRAKVHRSTWVLDGASHRTEADFDDYVKGVRQVTKVHPFELHIIFLATAISSWRPYLRYLSEQVAEIVSMSIMVV